MTATLSDYLKKNNIIGIEGVDTRALTSHLRKFGAKKGVLSTLELDPKKLVKQAKDSPGLIGRDLVKEVSCDKPYHWSELPYDLALPVQATKPFEEQLHLHHPEKVRAGIPIAALDCGIKYNILRKLTAEGFDVTVFPANTKVEGLMNQGFRGVFLSNGPGDPEGVPYVIETVRHLIDKNVPTFGICLGHQILGLALGGKTYKLKFGHRGGNQPVMNTINQKVEITSQNHGLMNESPPPPPSPPSSSSSWPGRVAAAAGGAWWRRVVAGWGGGGWWRRRRGGGVEAWWRGSGVGGGGGGVVVASWWRVVEAGEGGGGGGGGLVAGGGVGGAWWRVEHGGVVDVVGGGGE